jgi:uncharacterized repeat protein (TIGR03803 family)
MRSFNHRAPACFARRQSGLLLCAVFAAFPVFGAEEFSVLHSFSSFDGGQQPGAGLTQGSDGKLYGMTSLDGGDDLGGTLFQMDSNGANFKVIHAFTSSEGAGGTTPLVKGKDGRLYGATGKCFFRLESDLSLSILDCQNTAIGWEMVAASDGNFYGTTLLGGAHASGSVFRLTTSGAFTTLYSFTGGADGQTPTYGLSDGGDGFFYGTASGGGSGGGGTVYRVDTKGKLTTLYSFKGQSDGSAPAGVLKASDGNLYGATFTNPGTLYRLTPGGSLQTLHTFNVTDGVQPAGRPEQSAGGAMYGQTISGGSSLSGTLYRLELDGEFSSVYSFTGSSGNGPGPAPLSLADDGNLYGTTARGGGGTSFGTAFVLKLDPVPPPGAPEGLSAVAGDAEVTLKWAAVDGAVSYSVFQSLKAGEIPSSPVKSGVTDTSLTIAGLENGTTYFFTVAAVNAGGMGARSDEVSATPQAVPATPTGLTATAGDAKVVLSWQASAGATGYSVYQGTSASSLSPVATGVEGTSYTASGLSNGTTYYFDVVATNGSGASAHSGQATATPQAASPDPADGGDSGDAEEGDGGGGAFSPAWLIAAMGLYWIRRRFAQVPVPET